MVADKFKDLEIVVRFHCILIYCPMICNGSKGGSNPPGLGSNPSGRVMTCWLNWYSIGLENRHPVWVSGFESLTRRSDIF